MQREAAVRLDLWLAVLGQHRRPPPLLLFVEVVETGLVGTQSVRRFASWHRIDESVNCLSPCGQRGWHRCLTESARQYHREGAAFRASTVKTVGVPTTVRHPTRCRALSFRVIQRHRIRMAVLRASSGKGSSVMLK